MPRSTCYLWKEIRETQQSVLKRLRADQLQITLVLFRPPSLSAMSFVVQDPSNLNRANQYWDRHYSAGANSGVSSGKIARLEMEAHHRARCSDVLWTFRKLPTATVNRKVTDRKPEMLSANNLFGSTPMVTASTIKRPLQRQT